MKTRTPALTLLSLIDEFSLQEIKDTLEIIELTLQKRPTTRDLTKEELEMGRL